MSGRIKPSYGGNGEEEDFLMTTSNFSFLFSVSSCFIIFLYIIVICIIENTFSFNLDDDECKSQNEEPKIGHFVMA